MDWKKPILTMPKLLRPFLLLSFCLLLASCSEDALPDISQTNAVALLGDWNLEAVSTSNGSIITTVDGLPVTAEFSAIGRDFNYQVSFSEDPNVATGMGSYATDVTITIGDQTVTETAEGENFFTTSFWRLEDNAIILMADDLEALYSIVDFTDDTLILETSIDFEEEEFGITVRTSVDYSFTFTR